MEALDAKVLEWLGHLEHYLPAQKPLEAFVHHNTLHSFEHLPFNEAVETAAKLFGAEPYMTEEAFREAWQNGRILERDLDTVLEQHVADEEIHLAGQSLPLREVVRAWMLGMPEEDGGTTLQWRLEETDEIMEYPSWLPRHAFERLSGAGPAHVQQPALWQAVTQRKHPEPTNTRARRARDSVLSHTGTDTDSMVNPVLIRWCGAFLDPGHSYWPMTDREQGFYVSMLSHMSQLGPVRGWMAPLTGRAQLLLSSSTSAERCIHETLARMGWKADEMEDFIADALLAMPGWPGMFVQLAARPDLAPGPPPPTPLQDYVAIRLLLEEASARYLEKTRSGPLPRRCAPPAPRTDPDWSLFNAARLLGVLPEELDAGVMEQLEALLSWHGEYPRRWLWQLAYERRYRIGILDGVMNHWARIAQDQAPTPRVQLITCIDDREESLRRHLEELGPQYETLGAAGFYGVAAYFRPLGEPHQSPLCPASVVPTHLLKEVPADTTQWTRIQRSRSLLGRVWEALNIGSDTLFRGGLISLWGWSSILPMVTRILAPRLHGKLTASREEPATQLLLEAEQPPTADHGLQVGFEPQEMVAIVRKMLEDMGLTRNFAPLVVFLGHGSRSLNNPHEAAHDCGACGGGRGGPNARAFAAMGNRPDIRAALREVGIDIPDSTWFVGGYHNTCDDNVDLYDLDLVPETHRASMEQTQRDLEHARKLDAHERVRRFESASLDLDPNGALEHVENRAEDLAQPRPEYGHCTNALHLVGRRSWNRGLFLDRRVFLTSYDPEIDPEGTILERLLASVGPVGAGISLEYYFSFVDPNRYGCNTKLPHNITALMGVMDGHSSDLRTGLPWQMVEIHEPVRLLNIIEGRPEQLLAILERQPGLKQLIVNRWILVAAFDPATHEMWFFEEEGFVPYTPETTALGTAETSVDWYQGHREHLPLATIEKGRARSKEVAA